MKNAVTCCLVGLLGGAVGCSGGGGGGGGGGEQAEGYMTGRAVDARGTPLAGVKVWADNTLLYNTNAGATTGTDGTYRIDVRQPAGTWHASATLQRQYNGRSYTFDLDPSDDSVFAGNAGAVRNFTWRLSGKRPELGSYGGFVVAYVSQLLDPADPSRGIDSEDIELTLTPDGKLVDGSDGAPITKKLARTGDGDAVEDVPVGRYRITARYVQEGKAPRPMQVRVRDTGEPASSVTADFETVVGSAQRIELELQLPED
ncbi:carboxypeptidase-like regulatory domain-containing protein [Pyxidicoccus xibeiensis]|uniref:carboxypeptidase-like regulatory domain-containing protein n=1 Tax=Pyxidicoccus xibeiensis TaxID=2906759 RepID=UPI0020A7F158|nr:carboxypeptidase-like regulatory domain-containing protein [Pyxidicoccus xibeiensis]MCP3140545.1 carboxypeptidase-like regulatory domain-containing protein [Pyxidicoccus xibeiensis]